MIAVCTIMALKNKMEGLIINYKTGQPKTDQSRQ
jgi:hypothetical protein